MKTTIAALILAAAATLPAAANARDLGDTGTAGASTATEANDSCMLGAMVRVSYTNVRDDEVYGLARKQCGRGRAGADTEEAATWTRLVGGLRDRRRQQDAMYGIREIAAR